MPRSDADILADLSAVVRRTFPDRDFPDDVAADTLVFADLGLASIDVIVLAEKLEAHYGQKLPFPQFLAALKDRGADDVPIGEFVTFLKSNVN